jgi:hypothetical protein
MHAVVVEAGGKGGECGAAAHWAQPLTCHVVAGSGLDREVVCSWLCQSATLQLNRRPIGLRGEWWAGQQRRGREKPARRNAEFRGYFLVRGGANGGVGGVGRRGCSSVRPFVSRNQHPRVFHFLLRYLYISNGVFMFDLLLLFRCFPEVHGAAPAEQPFRPFLCHFHGENFTSWRWIFPLLGRC